MSLQSKAATGVVTYASAYAVDKIVGIYQGTFTAGADTTTIAGFLFQYTIPHKFTRPVFTELLWSTDGISYNDGGGSGNTSSGHAAIAYSDANNLYVTTTVSSGTIYYKLVASWIDSYDSTNPSITPVLNTTKNIYFDTRANYQKLYLSGMTTALGPGFVSATTVITHGLGYKPAAKVYFESVTGQVWPQIDGGTNDIWLYAPGTQAECHTTISASNLNITYTIPASGANTRIWYHIYLNTVIP